MIATEDFTAIWGGESKSYRAGDKFDGPAIQGKQLLALGLIAEPKGRKRKEDDE